MHTHEGAYLKWCLKSKMKHQLIALNKWEEVWAELSKINKNEDITTVPENRSIL